MAVRPTGVTVSINLEPSPNNAQASDWRQRPCLALARRHQCRVLDSTGLVSTAKGGHNAGCVEVVAMHGAADPSGAVGTPPSADVKFGRQRSDVIRRKRCRVRCDG